MPKLRTPLEFLSTMDVDPFGCFGALFAALWSRRSSSTLGDHCWAFNDIVKVTSNVIFPLLKNISHFSTFFKLSVF